MKISVDELKSAYRMHVADQGRSVGEGCPWSARTAGMFDPKLPRSVKSKRLAHVTSCAECAELFDSLVRLQRRIQADLPTSAVREEETEYRRSVPKRNGPAWSWKSVLTGALVFGTAALLLVWQRRPDVERSVRPDPLKALRPAGDVRPEIPFRFEWSGLTDVIRYRVELFDDGLSLMWQSPFLTGTQAVLDPELSAGLKSGRYYFWSVSAQMPAGGWIESSLTRFRPTSIQDFPGLKGADRKSPFKMKAPQ